MTFNQSEKLIEEIRMWYVSEIHRAADKAGGMMPLAFALGYANPKQMYQIIGRNSFKELREVVKKIHGGRK